MTPDAKTFQFGRILTKLSTISLECHSLLRDDAVGPKARKLIGDIKRRADISTSEMRRMLTPESRKIMDDELVAPGVALQVESISEMLVSLPLEMRDQADEFICGLYKQYNQQQ